jgi:hypothetical protein
VQQTNEFLSAKLKKKRGSIKKNWGERRLGLISYSRRNASQLKLLHPKPKEDRYVAIYTWYVVVIHC